MTTYAIPELKKSAVMPYIRNIKKADRLNSCWNALQPRQKRYARELVERFGWRAEEAIQRATIWCPARKFDEWIYDYRESRACGEHVSHEHEVNGRTGRIAD